MATGRALAVPPAAPSRSLLKLLIATRRHLLARTPRTAVGVPRRRTSRPVPCTIFPQPARALAWLSSLPLLRKRVSSLPLCSPPCSTRRAEPSAASRAAAACHLRRPSLGSRGAPSSGLPRAHPTPQLAPPPSVGAPRPTRRRPSPPERRRRKPSPPPAAPLRGAAASDLLPANQGHPEVRLSPLYLFPHISLAAGEQKHRKSSRPTLLCAVPSAKDLP